MAEKRTYVLERDRDYPLPGQRWTAYCDEDDGRYAAEINGMGACMEDLIAEFSVYLGERHADAKRLRITVEEIE